MKTKLGRSLLVCLASGAPIVATASPADRVLRTELTVAAPLAEAWNTFVLPHLVHRFTSGPIDWGKRPTVVPVAKTLKVELAAK